MALRRLHAHFHLMAALQAETPDKHFRQIRVFRIKTVVHVFVYDEPVTTLVGKIDPTAVANLEFVRSGMRENLGEERPARGCALERDAELARVSRQIGEIERVKLVEIDRLSPTARNLVGEFVDRIKISVLRRIG